MEDDTLGIKFCLGLFTHVTVPIRPKPGCELGHMLGTLTSKSLEPSNSPIVYEMRQNVASFHDNSTSRAEGMPEDCIETSPASWSSRFGPEA